MFEFFAEFLAPLVDFFVGVYHADEQNPEAQRITLGCGLVVFTAIGLFVLWMVWR